MTTIVAPVFPHGSKASPQALEAYAAYVEAGMGQGRRADLTGGRPIDNNAGKPEGIHLMIGRRPVAAFGNSDGDLQMFQ